MGGRFRLLLACLAVYVTIACAAGPRVVRIENGRKSEGRFVSVDAYAAYAVGALLERRGDDQGAVAAFSRALAEDDQSADIVTRLGTLYCRLGQWSEADASWERARRIDPNYAPLWRERARCLLRRGRPWAALAPGLFAVELDPDDEAASVVVADAFLAQGDRAKARTLLEGPIAYKPGATAARKWLNTQGRPDAGTKTAADEVDRWLESGDLAQARAQAKKANIAPGELAARALALGQARIATQQSELVLGADPRNSDAWVAALGAADLAPDEVRLDGLLRSLDAEPILPGPLSSWLFAELLARRVGPAIARDWLQARQLEEEPGDPTQAALVARVKALVGGP